MEKKEKGEQDNQRITVPKPNQARNSSPSMMIRPSDNYTPPIRLLQIPQMSRELKVAAVILDALLHAPKTSIA